MMITVGWTCSSHM